MTYIYTLSKGKRAKKFGYVEYGNGVELFTGINFDYSVCLSANEVNKILHHFQDKGWFILGNKIDDIKANGLGEFVQSNLKKLPKYASHIAAYLCQSKRLICRDDNGVIELKTT